MKKSLARSALIIWHTVGGLIALMIVGGLIITGLFKNSDEAWNVFGWCFMAIAIVALPFAVVVALVSHRPDTDTEEANDTASVSDADDGRD